MSKFHIETGLSTPRQPGTLSILDLATFAGQQLPQGATLKSMTVDFKEGQVSVAYDWSGAYQESANRVYSQFKAGELK